MDLQKQKKIDPKALIANLRFFRMDRKKLIRNFLVNFFYYYL